MSLPEKEVPRNWDATVLVTEHFQRHQGRTPNASVWDRIVARPWRCLSNPDQSLAGRTLGICHLRRALDHDGGVLGPAVSCPRVEAFLCFGDSLVRAFCRYPEDRSQ
jgi:hypothetical protein